MTSTRGHYGRADPWGILHYSTHGVTAAVAPGPVAQYQPVVDTFTTSKQVILDNMAAIKAAVVKLQVGKGKDFVEDMLLVP